ncbi:MAG: hypothetical protein KA175_02295 [Flavobacteriales bacterium]|nr:hypothetical protein [Flavobacteriales bacterium]MBP6696418.1 hypothetical protein [Flavobacteriales bacterium]
MNEDSNHPIARTVTGQVGYNSTHSAYLAQTSAPFGTDTFDLIIGNFDLSGISTPRGAEPRSSWMCPALHLHVMCWRP